MTATVTQMTGAESRAPVLGRAMEGDDLAFAELVREHEAMVFSIAWHGLQNIALAEEVAQEVFLKLYRHLRRIESPDHLVFWLRRVTTNRVIDEARKRARIPLSLDQIPEPVDPTRAGDPLMSRRLREMLQKLPMPQRLAVTLRYQEGMEPREIAETLEIPLNTVKSHLRRAVSALRSALEHGKRGQR
ncbi:MAG TPA: sigma-70 family RNA polymerase sigma factor [Thermoanaerobaculia bacterium]|nr:sigma-70 family RNA polymerase sigma factor [Thermoanaerobaculia bacterium]